MRRKKRNGIRRVPDFRKTLKTAKP